MDYKKNDYDLERIKHSLRKGAIERNVKTGLIVAAAASGAIISAPALLVSAGITMGALYIANSRQRNPEDKNESVDHKKRILPGNE